MKNKTLISKNSRIMIAGSSGMVGSAIKEKLISSNYGNLNTGGNIYSK